jgi:hypothetical protein
MGVDFGSASLSVLSLLPQRHGDDSLNTGCRYTPLALHFVPAYSLVTYRTDSPGLENAETSSS